MLKNILTAGVLAVLLSVGLAGVAVAGEGDYTDIRGTDEFVFSATETASDRIAKAHVYDQDELSRVGTEAGNWKYEPMSLDRITKAHVYNQDVLSNVGTEAGNWKYNSMPSEQKASEGGADKADKMDAICSNC